MIQPFVLKKNYPVEVGSGKISVTTRVWQILKASALGDTATVKSMVEEEPPLAYAQYNYMPPVHLAVREGHNALVGFLLERGAYDPTYRSYPFLESLPVLAAERGHYQIAEQLLAFDKDQAAFKGDNGSIHIPRTPLQQSFEQAVDKEDLAQTRIILQDHPEFALDETYFWGEGILAMPAKEANFELIDLLMEHGATVTRVLKWAPQYHFERYDGAAYMLGKGMDPDTMSIHHVTILHNMAQKGDIKKAGLLLRHGAFINAVDEEYRSTPLGFAARWGHTEMVQFLLSKGADHSMAGATWATPLAWAKSKAHENIIALLIAAGAQV